MDPIISRREPLVKSMLFIAICFTLTLFYFPLTKNWFLSDDIHWIWSSATIPFGDMFFVPERYRALASNFTPMLGASFRIDWMLSKMNSVAYAIHSLVSLLATAVVFYYFLRLYVTQVPALAGVLLFFLSPITLSVTSWFSTRHYIEGLFWALLSLYSFVRSERAGTVSLFAGIFFLLSSLNKEVYVVLPAVAFLLSTEGMLKRCQRTLPLWSGLLVYTLWRLWMMKGVGGYPSNQPLDMSVIPSLFSKIAYFYSLHLSGEYHIFLYLLLAIAFILSLKHVKVLFIFLILCIPIVPVSNILDLAYTGGRYFLHISVFMICAACLFAQLSQVKSRPIYRGVLSLVFLLIVAVFIRQDFRISAVIREDRLKAKETADVFLRSEKTYIASEQPLWFYENLRKIYRVFYGKEIRTRLVPPENFLLYASPEKVRDMRESGVDLPYEAILASQDKFKQGPLSAGMILNDYRLSWDFGPDKHMMYTVLRGPVSGLYYNQSVVGPAGSVMLGKMNKDAPDIVYIRILYHSQKGEVVISPEFILSIPGNQKIEYTHQEPQP